ncbi:uncharacterized protein METZ01_LOCUS229714, partial [marine metagenome]
VRDALVFGCLVAYLQFAVLEMNGYGVAVGYIAGNQ